MLRIRAGRQTILDAIRRRLTRLQTREQPRSYNCLSQERRNKVREAAKQAKVDAKVSFSYPNREASFFNDFQENKALSSNIRYFFPVGCKGIDTLIDNSSRLRTMGIPVPDARPYFPTPKPDVKPRLPVTLKPSTSNGYVYNTPPNSYIPPGPSHIYAPELVPVTTKKPPSVYLPPKETTTPAKPTNIYLPPVTPTSLYLPPVTTKRTTTYKPTPPHSTPTSLYLPPVTTKRTTTYRPPPPHPTKPRPVISQEISPPAVPQHCESSTSCCEEASAGSFVIPIPLANGNGSGCCKLVAKLILPINGFDDDSIKKLRSSVSQEIDATQIIKKVLRNLL